MLHEISQIQAELAADAQSLLWHTDKNLIQIYRPTAA